MGNNLCILFYIERHDADEQNSKSNLTIMKNFLHTYNTIKKSENETAAAWKVFGTLPERSMFKNYMRANKEQSHTEAVAGFAQVFGINDKTFQEAMLKSLN